MVQDILIPVLLTALLMAAAATDLRWRRLPNLLTLGGAGTGLLLGLVAGGPEGLLRGLAGWVLGIGLLLPFFLMRGMGAGDVKLLGAVGAFGGPILVLSTAIWAGLIGGVFALALLLRRRQLVAAIVGVWLTRSLPTLDQPGAVSLPYGVAIAAGGLIALFLSGGGVM